MRGIKIEDEIGALADRELVARLMADPVRDVRTFTRAMLQGHSYLKNGRLNLGKLRTRLRRRAPRYWGSARFAATWAALRRRATASST